MDFEAKYINNFRLIRKGYDSVKDEIAEYISESIITENSNILILGCHDGYFDFLPLYSKTIALKRINFTLVEKSDGIDKLIKDSKINVDYNKVDVNEFIFKYKKYDLAIAFFFFNHLINPVKTLRQVFSSLKAKGKFLFLVYNDPINEAYENIEKNNGIKNDLSNLLFELHKNKLEHYNVFFNSRLKGCDPNYWKNFFEFFKTPKRFDFSYKTKANDVSQALLNRDSQQSALRYGLSKKDYENIITQYKLTDSSYELTIKGCIELFEVEND